MWKSTCFAGVTATRDVEGQGGIPMMFSICLRPMPRILASRRQSRVSRLKAYKGDTAPYFVNSNIAAANILSVSIAFPEINNDGVPFGITADYIKALKIKTEDGTIPYKNLYKQSDVDAIGSPPGDAEIRLY